MALPLVCVRFLFLQPVPQLEQTAKNAEPGSQMPMYQKARITSIESRIQHDTKVGSTLYQIVNSPIFNVAVAVAVILNCIALTLDHYPQNKEWDDTLAAANTVFVVVFVLEAVLKVFGYGPKLYWESWFNRVDLFVTVMGVAELALIQSVEGSSTYASMFSLFPQLRRSCIHVPAGLRFFPFV